MNVLNFPMHPPLHSSFFHPIKLLFFLLEALVFLLPLRHLKVRCNLQFQEELVVHFRLMISMGLDSIHVHIRHSR